MITIEIKESSKLKDEYSAFVSFDYSSTIVNVLRSLPFKVYNPETTTWEIPVNKVETIIKQLQNFDISLIGKLSLLNNEQEKIELPEGFEFKTKPYSHQIEGVEYGLKYDRWFLGDEMGLGKTKQTIDIAVARKAKYGYKHCLIVCGVNTLKWNWVNEITTHSAEGAWILGQKWVKNNWKAISSEFCRSVRLAGYTIAYDPTMEKKTDSHTEDTGVQDA